MTLHEDLAAEGEPEVEFHKGIAARLPRKRVASGALVRNTGGYILMMETPYKPMWEIPGGVAEENEPPLATCRREIREELGIDLPIGDLLVIDWVPRQGVWSDAVLYIFDGGVITPEQIDAIDAQPDEVTAIKFVTLAEACEHVRPSMARRLGAAVLALQRGRTINLEFGRPTSG